MMNSLLPEPILQFSDANGAPYAGGALAFYEQNTFTPMSTYQDIGGTIHNTNPIVLDGAGRSPPIFGNGIYRVILTDSLGDQIWDGVTSSYLGTDAISPVMLPVTEAATLAEARRLMGIDDAIQAAILTVDLIPGPQGPPGVGIQGVPGPEGPAGSSSSTTSSRGNPGYFYDPNTGYLCSFGIGQADGTGLGSITFPLQYTSISSVVVTPLSNPTNVVPRITILAGNAFQTWLEDTDNTRGFPYQFTWAAHGFR